MKAKQTQRRPAAETKKAQVVFFDLDGTLIDTSHRHYRVYKDILDSNKITDSLSEEKFWSQKRNGRKTVEFCPEEFRKTFLTEWLMKIEERNYLIYDTVFPESLDVLSRLKEKIDLVLVTLRKHQQNLLWQLNELELTDFFSEVLVDSPSSKTKVAIVAEYLKNNPQKNSCTIVGDSEVDMNTGKQMAFSTIAFTNGLRSRAFLSKMEPDFFVDNLQEVLPILAYLR